MKLNYLFIPLIAIAVFSVGSALTGPGLGWYQTLKVPAWTPGGQTISLVWTAIFVLTALAALLFYNKAPNYYLLLAGGIIFLINAFLNVFWSYLFFSQHLIYEAMIEAGVLGLSVVILIFLTLPVSLFASILLLPYAGWVGFAAYLNYQIWLLNLPR